MEKQAVYGHDMWIVETIVRHRGLEANKFKDLEFKQRWRVHKEDEHSWVPWRVSASAGVSPVCARTK